MKKPIFKVNYSPVNNNEHNNKSLFRISNPFLSNNNEDDKLSEIYRPCQNQNIPSLPKKETIFIIEKTTDQTPNNTLPSFIWKEQDVILFFTDKILDYIVIYLNNFLALLGIKEKFFPIFEDIINNTDNQLNDSFLFSTLEEIISGKLIKKNSKKKKNNIQLIKYLLDKNYTVLRNFLKLTFFDYLQHFRKTKSSHFLFGFDEYYKKTMKELEKKEGKDCMEYFNRILSDYENILPTFFKNEKEKTTKMEID